ncbi:SAM-dependent methyltransferase [Sulfitobacter sp. S0837]|uniref:methyltransferase domain-containing protein n=1 Tax=Sulfitobacter maritimus TaxID=2741719 RepID=UPI001581C00D|nr:methyltransferase domain-containing protein [Sulfitobacter maritimus]NUH66907.1 SAM-dependent methyltransferase [Sulfitobacter maritimus]
MTTQPSLTDPTALAQHRARATGRGMFLQETAFDEVKDRLEVVNKSFTAPAIVTGFPQIWSALHSNAKLVPDSETLDLTPQTHDLVVHAMGLHWANDPIGQFIQCRRALRPDGLLQAVAFGGQTLHELRACLGQAEAEITGGMSPRIAPMAELRDLGGLLQRAGLALPVADSLPLTVEYADAWALMRDLRAMGETNALGGRLRRPTARGVLNRAAELYTAHFTAPSGRITATFDLIFLTGWAPDDSQPKPLRPGSAQQRLADALNSREEPLPD